MTITVSVTGEISPNEIVLRNALKTCLSFRFLCFQHDALSFGHCVTQKPHLLLSVQRLSDHSTMLRICHMDRL